MATPPDYDERVYAGVLGKLIGVYLGRPFEGWDHARIMADLGPVEDYVHARFGVPLVVTDDDIAGTFTFPRALEDHGFDPALSSASIGDTWLNYIVERRSVLWWGGLGISTEETAWRRLRAGLRAPRSGAIETNGRTMAEQIGAQIFIDGWAMVSPGDPDRAARLARAAARVSHDGEAVHAAVLIAVMESLSFVEPDISRLLDAGLRAIPPDCLIARVVGDVRRWSERHADWTVTRSAIEAEYGYHRFPGSCHVVPNHAVVLMALLYAGDDFGRAVSIAATAGWDTDCNAGNVGCLTALRLGLPALRQTSRTDWRSPVRDRVIVSTADGGGAITDAVRVAERLAAVGRRVAGEPARAPAKDGARFHFSMPGSVQGFAVVEGGSEEPYAALKPERLADNSAVLALRFQGLCPGRSVSFETPTFIPGDVGLMRTYDLLASPTLNPGQVLRARVLADAANGGTIGVALVISVYDADDVPSRIASKAIAVANGAATVLSWRIPDLGGRPIASVGIQITAGASDPDGVAYLDWLDWTGCPDVVLRRPDSRGTFWRRAWVDAVSVFDSPSAKPFQIAQNEGRGLLIYGAREWPPVRVESELTMHLGEGGLAVSVHGLRRFRALLLRHPNRVVLVRAWDGDEQILADAAFPWKWDCPVRLALAVRDQRIVAEGNGRILFEIEDHGDGVQGGAVALVIDTGALSTQAVAISDAADPPRGGVCQGGDGAAAIRPVPN